MQLTELDARIIATIDRIRATHHACTGAEVAAQMKMSKSYIFTRIGLMREAGIVAYTTMPGSLRVVAVPASDAAEPDTGELAVAATGEQQDAATPSVGDPDVDEPAGSTAAERAAWAFAKLKQVADESGATERVPSEGDGGQRSHQAPRTASKRKSAGNSSGTQSTSARTRSSATPAAAKKPRKPSTQRN